MEKETPTIEHKGVKHYVPKLSAKAKKRLLALADIIEKVPRNNFRMSVYLSAESDEVHLFDWEPDADQLADLETCGTIGCVLGHAALHSTELKIRVPVSPGIRRLVNWYLLRNRLVEGDPRGTGINRWLFEGDWVGTDNDPITTAKRIRYTVKYGVPANSWDQMAGITPLSYLED